MNFFKKSIFITRDQWPGLGLNICSNIKEYRYIYLKSSLERVKCNNLPLTNSNMIKKMKVAFIAHQLFHILQIIPRYINSTDGQEFVNFLTIQICETQEVYNCAYEYLLFIKSFEDLGEDACGERALLFSLDTVKMICGLSIDILPSYFDRDKRLDYVFNDIPESLKNYFLNTALEIARLEFNLRSLTTFQSAICFGDKEYANVLMEDLKDYNRSNFDAI